MSDIMKELKRKYYSVCSNTGLGIYNEPHVDFNDLNQSLNEIEELHNVIQELGKVVEFYGDKDLWHGEGKDLSGFVHKEVFDIDDFEMNKDKKELIWGLKARRAKEKYGKYWESE